MCHLQEIGEEAEVALAGHCRKLGRNLPDIMGDLLWGRVKSAVCRGAPGSRRRLRMSDELLASRSGCVFCERSHHPSRPECKTKAYRCRSRCRQRIMQSHSCIFRYELESLLSDFACGSGVSYRYFGHAAAAAQERSPSHAEDHAREISGLGPLGAGLRRRHGGLPGSRRELGLGARDRARDPQSVGRAWSISRLASSDAARAGREAPFSWTARHRRRKRRCRGSGAGSGSTGERGHLSAGALFWRVRLQAFPATAPCGATANHHLAHRSQDGGAQSSCVARQALPPPSDAGMSWRCVDARQCST